MHQILYSFSVWFAKIEEMHSCYQRYYEQKSKLYGIFLLVNLQNAMKCTPATREIIDRKKMFWRKYQISGFFMVDLQKTRWNVLVLQVRLRAKKENNMRFWLLLGDSQKAMKCTPATTNNIQQRTVSKTRKTFALILLCCYESGDRCHGNVSFSCNGEESALLCRHHSAFWAALLPQFC